MILRHIPDTVIHAGSNTAIGERPHAAAIQDVAVRRERRLYVRGERRHRITDLTHHSRQALNHRIHPDCRHEATAHHTRHNRTHRRSDTRSRTVHSRQHRLIAGARPRNDLRTRSLHPSRHPVQCSQRRLIAGGSPRHQRGTSIRNHSPSTIDRRQSRPVNTRSKRPGGRRRRLDYSRGVINRVEHHVDVEHRTTGITAAAGEQAGQPAQERRPQVTDPRLSVSDILLERRHQAVEIGEDSRKVECPRLAAPGPRREQRRQPAGERRPCASHHRLRLVSGGLKHVAELDQRIDKVDTPIADTERPITDEREHRITRGEVFVELGHPIRESGLVPFVAQHRVKRVNSNSQRMNRHCDSVDSKTAKVANEVNQPVTHAGLIQHLDQAGNRITERRYLRRETIHNSSNLRAERFEERSAHAPDVLSHLTSKGSDAPQHVTDRARRLRQRADTLSQATEQILHARLEPGVAQDILERITEIGEDRLNVATDVAERARELSETRHHRTDRALRTIGHTGRTLEIVVQ